MPMQRFFLEFQGVSASGHKFWLVRIEGWQMNCERARLIRPSRYWHNHLTNSLLAVLIVGLVLVLPIPCAAQRTTGTLRGQVLDPAGAAVANAQVTATNQQTGVSIKTATTTAGTYNFPSILPGRYSVTVEMPGFKIRSPPRMTCLC